MNFQNIRKIETPDFYLDVAFRKAKQRAAQVRSTSKRMKNPVSKSKNIELERLSVVKNVLTDTFDKVIKSYPSLDDMSEFYKELIRATLDFADIKRCLGALNSAKLVIGDIYRIYNGKIKKTQDIKKIAEYKREFFGRISSVPKRIKAELIYLEIVRKTFRNYPSIKEELMTVAIAGFPNVGKSTLLLKVTTANPEIKTYPFTTKGLNMGYMEGKYEKIQFIDTPGTLNRFEKMNYIERIAYLAMKYAAQKIIYVFDLTEEYPLKDQEKLLKRVRELGKPVIIYISKTDLLDKKVVEQFLKTHKTAVTDFNKIISEFI